MSTGVLYLHIVKLPSEVPDLFYNGAQAWRMVRGDRMSKEKESRLMSAFHSGMRHQVPPFINVTLLSQKHCFHALVLFAILCFHNLFSFRHIRTDGKCAFL